MQYDPNKRKQKERKEKTQLVDLRIKIEIKQAN